MSATEAAHASPPAAEEGKTETKQRKEKKSKTDEHRSHDRKHKHSKRSKTGDAASATAGATTAGSSSNTLHHPTQDAEEDWEENRAAVERLCAQYPNNICCDCGESGTRWASVNHGVFVCIRCSGVHRSLGTHVSKVKSTNMDRWSLAEVRLMEAIGNAKGKTLFEARLPAGTRPSIATGGVADDALKSFIQRKYAGRDFAMHNVKDVLGRLYKDTGYGRPPKKAGRTAESSTTASSSTRDDTRVDRVAISGRRGDTMRALYGDAAEAMQRGAASRKKGAGADHGAAAAAAADAAPKPTYGAFGLVNVPPQEYEARLRRTVELFTHVEEASTGAKVERSEEEEGEGGEVKKGATAPPAAAEAAATVMEAGDAAVDCDGADIAASS